MKTETPQRDAFLQWGRSGSFYPLLKPAPQSQRAIEEIQAQIRSQSPTAELSDDLHSTFFYVKPPPSFIKGY